MIFYLVVDPNDDLALVPPFITSLNVLQLQRVCCWGRVVSESKPDGEDVLNYLFVCFLITFITGTYIYIWARTLALDKRVISLLFICFCFLLFCLFSYLTFYVPVISDDERGSGGERYWLVVCLCTRGKRILRGDKFDDYLVRKWLFLGRGWRISVGMWMWLNYMDTAMAVDVNMEMGKGMHRNIWKWERVCTGNMCLMMCVWKYMDQLDTPIFIHSTGYSVP